ncbi:zinc finger protein 236-like [Physella acuta]|uniref:zinc finger protein 236-like n=1 Tax=Physella acuta TaxID=109671 RepID=UPI0027DB57EB|nr:zinc finger protein 236-like [Physella acuta]
MADFVAEFRPRNRPPVTNPSSLDYPEGFVAEFRPRCLPSSCKNDAIQPMEFTDKDVISALSDKNFTKESITQLLEGSVLTLVEKLLLGRPLVRIEGRVSITIQNDEDPIVVNLNKHFQRPQHNNYDYLTELDPGLNVKLRDRYVSPPCEDKQAEHSGLESPVEVVTSPTFLNFENRGEDRPMCSPSYDSCSLPSPNTLNSNTVNKNEGQKRRDSDDESGYTSTGRDTPDATKPKEKSKNLQKTKSLFTDYYCNGFDGEPDEELEDSPLDSTSDKSDTDLSGSAADGSDEMEDDDLDNTFESPLVIDVETRMELDEARKPAQISFDKCDADVDAKTDIHSCLHTIEETDESFTSSDVTDLETDSPVDLTGEITKGRGISLSTPHPHSLVSKHQDGYKCKECHLVLPDCQAVSKHALEHHDIFSCTYCFRSFTAKNNLKRHVRIHTGSKPYKCSQCIQSFARRDDLKGHMLRHEHNKPFRCSLCHKGYTDRACVKNHMAKEHRARLMHVCPPCGESFDCNEAFSAHKKTHPELLQFSCKICSFIGTNNLMTLKHSLIHDRKLFSCKPCNAYFSDPFDYTYHVRKHKGNPDFCQYKCCFCEVPFSTYDQYIRHEYSHAQLKTNVCKICRKQCKSKSLLLSHLKSHQQPSLSKLPEVAKENAQAAISTKDIQWPAVKSVVTFPPPPVPLPQDTDTQGELLDLSLKKAPVPDQMSPRSASAFTPSQRPAGLSEICIPRNGYTAEAYNLTQEPKNADHSMSSVQEESKVNDEALRLSNGQRSWMKAVSPVCGGFRSHKYVSPVSPGSGDKNRSGGMNNLERILNQSDSNGNPNKTSLRFYPYSRQKMVELAEKYYVARGMKFAGPKMHLQNARPVNQQRECSPVLLPTILADEECNTHCLPQTVRKSPETLAPETPLLAVVKTEPMVESDLVSEINIESMNIKDSARSKQSRMEALNPHSCDFCKENFSSFTELEAHSVELHKRYLCEHCMKTFTTRPNRDRHARVHTGERPYKCDLCDLAFFRGDDLKYHRTTRHPSAPPYVCSRCSASFTWGRDLERHIKNSKCK